MSAAAAAYRIGTVDVGTLTLSDVTGTVLTCDEDTTGAQNVTFTLPANVYDIATQVNAQTTNITASIVNGNPDIGVFTGRFLRVESDTVGAGSTLVLSGTAGTLFGITGTATGHAARSLVEDYIDEIAEYQGVQSYTTFGKSNESLRAQWPRITWTLERYTIVKPLRQVARETRVVADAIARCRVRVRGQDLRRAEDLLFGLIDAIHAVMTQIYYEIGDAEEAGDGAIVDGVELTTTVSLRIPIERDRATLGNIQTVGLDLQAADPVGENPEDYDA